MLSYSVVGHRTVIGEGSIIHPSVSIMRGSIIEKNHHFKGEDKEEYEFTTNKASVRRISDVFGEELEKALKK